ncbi:MAG TPA: hypothetical protein VMX17_02790 [Candidatus Glassbacteria bacterium]|nr:hypothetical protein [Candidatus Glassbacteria bacterium]
MEYICSIELGVFGITVYIKKAYTRYNEPIMFSLFNRKSNAVRNWRSHAWSIDPQKTRLTILTTKPSIRLVPPWMFKKSNELLLISY